MTTGFGLLLSRTLRAGVGSARSGQAMIFFAVAAAMLIGFVGLVTDAGLVYVTRSRLQTVADAAALAGARELPVQGVAIDAACNYVRYNAIKGMFGNVQKNCVVAGGGETADIQPLQIGAGSEFDGIRVTVYKTVTPTFGAVLNFLPTHVSATALVRIGSIGQSCIRPFFLVTNDIKDPWNPVLLTRGSAIDVGSGASAIRDALKNNTCTSRIGTVRETVDVDLLDLKPGASSQFKDGWSDRLANVSSSKCPNANATTYKTADGKLDPALTLANCPRLIALPVLPNGLGVNGEYKGNEKGIPLRGFAVFYISNFCSTSSCSVPAPWSASAKQGDVWGYYVPLEVGDETVSGTYSNFNEQFGGMVIAMCPDSGC